MVKTNKNWIFVAAFVVGFLTVILLCTTYDSLIPVRISILIRCTLVFVFLGGVEALRNRPGADVYRKLLQALLAATVGLSLSWYLSPILQGWFGSSTDTPSGIALAKLISSTLIVMSIIIITKIYGFEFSDLYLCRGRFRSTLLWGARGFFLMVLLAFAVPGNREVPVPNVVALIPAIFVFILSNAFMEELLFRGLFLKVLENQSGRLIANLSTALVFTAGHLSVSYTPDLVVFLVVLFGLALLWGFLMQKTESIIGPAIFHAGADVIIVLGVFHSMGVRLDG